MGLQCIARRIQKGDDDDYVYDYDDVTTKHM